jgi:hypothetical protein
MLHQATCFTLDPIQFSASFLYFYSLFSPNFAQLFQQQKKIAILLETPGLARVLSLSALQRAEHAQLGGHVENDPEVPLE